MLLWGDIVAHAAKYTKVQVGGLTRHFERKKNENGEYIKFSNQEIDTLKTHFNYNLAENKNQLDFIKQRCSEVRCFNRADVNVMVSWVVTVPKELPKSDEDLFFKETYKFLNGRYGEENVISAYVHKDETMPHLHYAFVPVVQDKKRGDYKVSAKELVNKNDLLSFHQQLSKHLESVFSYDVGVLNEATKEGNKSIDELKRKSAVEQIQEVCENSEKIALETQERLLKLELDLKTLNIEYEAKKVYLRQYGKLSDVSVMYPNYATISKEWFGKQEYIKVPIEKWEAKHISANEKSYLRKAQEQFEENIKLLKKEFSAKKLIGLENEVAKLRDENKNLKNQIISKDNKIDNTMQKINDILSKMPNDFSKEFKEIWSKKTEPVKIQSKGFDFSR